MRLNLPNKLTVLRVILIPLMVVIYYLDPEPLELNLYSWIIAGLFVFASLTDYFDGYLARKHSLVTTFGKFLDPLADKLLVMFALLVLLDIRMIPMWVVLVILSREFIVTGIRLVSADEGKVIAASKLGKYKTASTMVALILLLVHVELAGLILLYIGVALTVISGLEYLIKNKSILTASK
ncbi:MAG: CDP-diacylglycerol--glycerol-3-phosphate 3-phosphatidyltransferase [Bacillota bacterium]